MPLREAVEHMIAVTYGVSYDAVVTHFPPYESMLEEIVAFVARSVPDATEPSDSGARRGVRDREREPPTRPGRLLGGRDRRRATSGRDRAREEQAPRRQPVLPALRHRARPAPGRGQLRHSGQHAHAVLASRSRRPAAGLPAGPQARRACDLPDLRSAGAGDLD